MGSGEGASLRSEEEWFREREGEELGGRSSLRISGAGVSGEDSSSDSRLKSSWSLRGRSRGGEEDVEVEEEEGRGRLLGWGGRFGLWAA